jgi:hypothetical protein
MVNFDLNKLKITRTEDIDITPDKSMAEKIGYVGFSPEAALAEFIDNSIDAKYDEETGECLIDEKINIEILIENDKIKISDNASGIKHPKECLKLSSSYKKGRLGSFGLGLKTASMSLGKKLTIITKYIGQPEGCYLTFDLETWYQYEGWKLKGVKYFEANEKDHGTTIIIEKLNINPKLLDLENIRKELAFRFGEFISNNEIEILVNGEKCIPEPLEFISQQEFEKILQEFGLSKEEFPSSRLEFSFTIGKFEVTGWVDLLAKWSYSGSRFGFNVYRGKRLLAPFQKIGMRDHPNYSRIFGHIYLPTEFPVAFTKDRMEVARIWGGRALADAINEKIKEYLRICEKLARKKIFTMKPETLRKTEEYLRFIEKAVKNSPLVQDVLKTVEEKMKAKREEAKGVDLVDVEKRGPKIRPTLKKPIPKGVDIRQPGAKRQKKKSFYIPIGGKKIKISHSYEYITEPPVRMYYDHYDEKQNELIIVTNMAFDSWNLVKGAQNEAFYAAMNVITALSEFIHDQAESSKYTLREIREDIWRNVGKMVYESL